MQVPKCVPFALMQSMANMHTPSTPDLRTTHGKCRIFLPFWTGMKKEDCILLRIERNCCSNEQKLLFFNCFWQTECVNFSWNDARQLSQVRVCNGKHKLDLFFSFLFSTSFSCSHCGCCNVNLVFDQTDSTLVCSSVQFSSVEWNKMCAKWTWNARWKERKKEISHQLSSV